METDGSWVIEASPAVPKVDIAKCSGCGRCVAACPKRILTLEISGFRKHASLVDVAQCTGCGLCSASCLLGAITTAESL